MLVNAAEHSSAVLGVLFQFCLLTIEHAQLKNQYNYSNELSTSVKSCFGSHARWG